ncbi:MAG: serine hydrolase domain-containing protein [Flavobacteriaceae bacterium]|nr:serine hydrolase domain-containing protein [Flavobacteriaceae bacterium]
MKFLGLFGLLLLTIISCHKRENEIFLKETLHKDTLNLPHFPYLDYDLQFKNQTFDPVSRSKKQLFVEDFFENYWSQNQVSGGLLVARNGQVIYENYRGYANVETKDTLNADTALHTASISKVLTALAVLKLVEADYLKLDQLVSNIFPEFPHKNITIRDLLNHRSGLPNYAYFEHHKLYWDTNKIKTNEDILQALIHKVALPQSQPNTSFSYSNTNYALLALIIEKITGLQYKDAMQYIIFHPLQMKNTFVFNIKDSAKVSQSYGYGGTRWNFDFLDQIYGDKNIYSTPRDLFKLDKAMYSKHFLTPKLKKLMTQGYSYEKKGVKNYGLGIRTMEWDTGQKLLYHNGWWHGNYTTYVRGETDSITIIALGNKQSRAIYQAFTLAGMMGNYPVMTEENQRLLLGKNSETSLQDSVNLEITETDLPDKSSEKLKKVKRKDSSIFVLQPKIRNEKLDSFKKQISDIH